MATLVCRFMGFAFLIVGIWGFITGSQVLIFHVNPAHNTVHLLSGLAALAVATRGEHASWIFSIVFGVVYGLVALLGFGGTEPIVSALHLNRADNWLHAGIAVLFLAGALASTMRVRLPARQVPQHT